MFACLNMRRIRIIGPPSRQGYGAAGLAPRRFGDNALSLWKQSCYAPRPLDSPIGFGDNNPQLWSRRSS